MARTINYIERMITDFERLESADCVDMICELFARLDDAERVEALRRIQFTARMAGLALPSERKARNGVGVCSFCNGTKVAYNTVEGQVVCPSCKGTGKAEMPALMTKDEVGQCGALALAEPEVKQ